MSAAEAKLAEVTARLGFDSEAGLAAVRELAAGPPVVLVTGPPRDDRTRLAAWLTETLPKATVQVTDLAGAEDRLWDVLVLGSPADRLLSAEEQRMLAGPARDGRVVLVAVTGVHRLGDGPDLAAARAELERLRLRPFLTPLGLHWWFLDRTGTDEGLAAEVVQRCAAGNVHEPAVRVALRRVGAAAETHCAPRLEERKRDLELLDSMRVQLVPAAEEARERARIRAMSAEDALRESVDRFYEQVVPACDRALAWLSCGSITPWEDVVHPLEKSWAALLDDVGQALGQHAAELHTELDRTIRTQLRMAEQLRVPMEPLSFADRQWATDATAEPIDRLTSVDLGPALERFAAEVGKFAPPDESDQEREGRMAQLTRRVGDEIDGRLNIPIPDRLAAGLDRNLRAIVQSRATAAAQAIHQLIETEGGADAATVAAWLESTTATTAGAVEERHEWYAAYLDLLDLLNRL